MPVTVVVGGQYGSEGKGKLVAYLARTGAQRLSVVRCGGTNAGHTIDVGGRPYGVRQLPSAAAEERCSLFLGAGMVIDPDLLFREIQDLAVCPSRVAVDRNAVILDAEDLRTERSSRLRERLGSTLSGTGSATARKVLRDPTQVAAGDHPQLKSLAIDVSRRLNELVDAGETIIVEGTQGAGLSLHHSRSYPFVTSRDTSAAAFLSEVGLAPTLATDVIVVFRTFPIRVAGNSGPLLNETSWEEITAGSGAPFTLSERTTVTNKLRRIARFDWELAIDAVRLNRPTRIALHGLDYVNFADRGVRTWTNLSRESKRFIDDVQSRLGVPVHFAFTGPSTMEVIDLRPGGTDVTPSGDLVRPAGVTREPRPW